MGLDADLDVGIFRFHVQFAVVRDSEGNFGIRGHIIYTHEINMWYIYIYIYHDL